MVLFAQMAIVIVIVIEIVIVSLSRKHQKSVGWGR